MIDRAARDQFAELLRHLVAGQVENRKYETAVPFSRVDPAIDEIHSNAVWPLYDDIRRHKLAGRWRIVGDNREVLARCVLFLKGTCEYEWPRTGGVRGLVYGLLTLVTVGVVAPLSRRRMRQYGDLEVWPFVRRSDYEAALKTAPYLSGAV